MIPTFMWLEYKYGLISIVTIYEGEICSGCEYKSMCTKIINSMYQINL